MSWKGWVTTAGDGGKFNTNELAFATKEEAFVYVGDLALRWTAVSDYKVEESDQPVNREAIRTDSGWEIRKVEDENDV